MVEVEQAAIRAAEACTARLVNALVDADRAHKFPFLRDEHTIGEIEKLVEHYGGRL